MQVSKPAPKQTMAAPDTHNGKAAASDKEVRHVLLLDSTGLHKTG